MDEAQASIRAARFADGLQDNERMLLVKDAVDRLHNSGLRVSAVRDKLDILEK